MGGKGRRRRREEGGEGKTVTFPEPGPSIPPAMSG